ncbi:MAG: peptidylprolyl isomerase [Gemmataceae bacterium]
MRHFVLLILAGVVLAVWPAPAEAKNPVVVMKTSLGDIKVELDADKAPVSTKNFLGYVDDQFYDGTIFHRVIPGFMVQGGGFRPNLRYRKPKDPIQNESGNGLRNRRGTIAMARGQALNSATSQFYINLVDNDALDANKYAVFGKVIDGMDVVDKIAKVKTGEKTELRLVEGEIVEIPHDDVPVADVVVESIRRVE